MTRKGFHQINEEVRKAWNSNASFWDEHMGEGNDFVYILEWPAMERMLDLKSNEYVLDIACGNGLTSRKMATKGAKVVAFDFSDQLIKLAKTRMDKLLHITYHVIDATDRAALRNLGECSFDAGICNMALFDMADIEPLFHALSHLLKPSGRFVFSILHPSFNNPSIVQMTEMEERCGEFITIHSVKLSRYITPYHAYGFAIHGQPKRQIYFHRSLQDILAEGFKVGFILDGLEERAFPPDYGFGSHSLSWSGKFSEIPPVMVMRMRLVNIRESG